MNAAGKRILRLLGWLLTPAVVWAASFLGGWIVASATAGDRGVVGLVQLGVGSVIGGTVGLIGWLILMRRRGASNSPGGEVGTTDGQTP